MVTRSTLNRQCPVVTRALRLQENDKSSGMKKKNCDACASTTTVSFAEETKRQRITEDLDSRDVRPHPR